MGTDHEVPPLSQEAAADLAAALKAARDEQDAFLRAVSHDLRAPLRHITAYGQLVRELVAESNADPAALQYLNTMAKSAQQLGHMIDGLINLGRIGREGVHCQSVSLGPLVADVVATLRAGQGERAIEWVLPDMEALPAVLADLGLLRDLLRHVLGNAVKFTRRQPQARIELQVRPLNGGEVELVLVDNGAGFNPDHQGQLFGVFQRLHPVTEYEGLGLGLAASRRIVDKLGGQIELQGEAGKGCTVRLRLPAA